MGKLFFTFLGIVFLTLVSYDIYATILHARGKSGPVSEFLCRQSWRFIRLIAFRLSDKRRHKILNAVGPVLMPTLIVTYIALLIVGYALIYFPHMPGSFTFSGEPGSRAWENSLYFSGSTLLTLGYGDITPQASLMRFVALVQAASGFALISLSLSYLVAVYRALEHKRAIALSFYHRAEGGPNVVGFLAHHFVAGRLAGLMASLRVTGRDLQETLESHIEHPIIHYFHPVQVYKGVPRVLFLSLEISAVIKSCLDEDEYEQIHNHPEVLTLESSARQVLGEFTELLDLDRRRRRAGPTFEASSRWKSRFIQIIDGLNAAGIKTEPDVESAWDRYSRDREDWEETLYHLSSYLGYGWNEVTGDLDMQSAEEKIEHVSVERMK